MQITTWLSIKKRSREETTDLVKDHLGFAALETCEKMHSSAGPDREAAYCVVEARNNARRRIQGSRFKWVKNHCFEPAIYLEAGRTFSHGDKGLRREKEVFWLNDWGLLSWDRGFGKVAACNHQSCTTVTRPRCCWVIGADDESGFRWLMNVNFSYSILPKGRRREGG